MWWWWSREEKVRQKARGRDEEKRRGGSRLEGSPRSSSTSSTDGPHIDAQLSEPAPSGHSEVPTSHQRHPIQWHAQPRTRMICITRSIEGLKRSTGSERASATTASFRLRRITTRSSRSSRSERSSVSSSSSDDETLVRIHAYLRREQTV